MTLTGGVATSDAFVQTFVGDASVDAIYSGDVDFVGSQGAQGLKGDTGDAGPQGPQGLKGDTGDAGPQGPHVHDVVIEPHRRIGRNVRHHHVEVLRPHRRLGGEQRLGEQNLCDQKRRNDAHRAKT